MLRIYGSAKSRAIRVLWLAEEMGIAYEHKDWLPRAPETRTVEYLAINPNGRVPTIDDDGFILSESMAINFYLAKKHRSPLYPADPKHEALMWQWCLWETDRSDRPVTDYWRHSEGLPPAERKPEIAAATLKELSTAFEILDKSMAKSPWLAGPAFSLADLNIAGALWRALTMDTAKWPHFSTWLRTCWDRPAAKKVWAMRTR